MNPVTTELAPEYLQSMFVYSPNVPKGSLVAGSIPRYPMTPNTEKAAITSTRELLMAIMRASCTALE
jgi:hypothetical protein